MTTSRARAAARIAGRVLLAILLVAVFLVRLIARVIRGFITDPVQTRQQEQLRRAASTANRQRVRV